MVSYRRGFNKGTWDKFWHWMDQCEEFPRGTCIMQRDRPAEELLCARCKSLNRTGRQD